MSNLANLSPVPVAHFEGKYLVYPDGRVQSLGDYKFISPSLNRNGYWKVALGLNGTKAQILLHQLVARHFLPNPYKHEQVNHIDGNKANNHVSNLEWISRHGNIQHSLEIGLRSGFMSMPDKEMYLARVLSGETVREVALAIGRREETLSKMLRVTAERIGKKDEWDRVMQQRRKDVAIRNLEKINS